MDRVLIIDDDRRLLDSFKRWMQRELRCEVHCASDREEAEALLDCYNYSLVLTDLSLSPQRLEGFDLIDRVANAPVRPKLITLTGHGSKRIRSDALRKGADAFFEKPTPAKEIIAIARELLGSDAVASPALLPPSEGLLAELLHPGAVRPYVQPIFRFGANYHTLVGVECLSRGPAGTPFEPADALFAYARRKRAEDVLDRHCISLALEAVSGIPKDVRISVNVHASTLGHCADFAGWLRSCAANNAIPLEQLTVEIVEHAPVWNKAGFLRVLDKLRDSGVKIALDDIGLGHSNYQMILDARPDYLKIDRYFINGCGRDPDRQAVVASIVKLANDLGGLVVAEGADTQDDLETLGTMGVEFAQCFLFSPPMPTSDFKRENALLTDRAQGPPKKPR
jgi:EAL domain-containing protein (putative c-di-GMP-specific phosphodiesterase class I)/CheY-like chemotaxis protein